MKRKEPYQKQVYRSLLLVMQLGIDMMVPILVLSVAGAYLDRKLGTSYIMILFFFLGAAAGARNVYRAAKKIYEEPQDGTADKAAGTAGQKREEP
ncbi:MAG: AtpZ/AtpI family protein [Clostridium sp.]|jgi:F0F1-type ATP synthase assembly protein I|nr:AtpZ/AtpI family protein [Clostridium sp.]